VTTKKAFSSLENKYLLTTFSLAYAVGLLNHLFGSKKGIAKELIIDENKKMSFLQKRLFDIASIRDLSMSFSFSEIDKALKDFSSTKEKLARIESLISAGWVSVGREERLEDEIIADINRLMTREDIEKLCSEMMTGLPKETELRKLLNEIYKTAKIIIRLIRLIMKKPSNVKNLLLELYKMILRLSQLCAPLSQESYYREKQQNHAKLIKLAKAIIFNEEINEKIIAQEESDEERFSREMAYKMEYSETNLRYKGLAHSIFLNLAGLSGGLEKDPDEQKKMFERMENLMFDEKLMYTIVKKLRPRYADEKIKIVILAFRKAYDLGYLGRIGMEM